MSMIITSGVIMPGRRLDEVERAQIEVLWRNGHDYATIASSIGRAVSTVWREIDRNNSYRHGPKNPAGAAGRGGNYHRGYKAAWAQDKADRRARRPKTPCLAAPPLGEPDSPLRAAVIEGLDQDWSPTQIAGRLRHDHPDDESMQVSPETIYQALYVQSRGGLRDLLGPQVLRSGRARRIGRRPDGCAPRSPRDHLLRISARPAEARDRAVPGHWEGDLILGARRDTAIATLVERSTRFLLLVALPERAHHDPIAVADALATHMLDLPQALRRSLTWDRGLEMVHGHPHFSLATHLPVYFADPHSPWQRGSNENTNGLLRQYFPKSTPLPGDQAVLDPVATRLNTRPRQTLNWQTPAEALAKLLVATAA
jgi:IS30 family transposase